MPGWSELLWEFSQVSPEERNQFLNDKLRGAVQRVSDLYGRNVLYYASAFLQKPEAKRLVTSISREDINGFMAGVYGCTPANGLLLILHTPGGGLGAAQTIVEYLRSIFQQIDALVPTYAMSAGTMIALGCDRIIMGRQSQLGPTDPQIAFSGKSYSAHSIARQFETAKADVLKDPILANAWAPILRFLSPALLEESRRTLDYCWDLVKGWLECYMFASDSNSATLASEVAEYFSGDTHGLHGRRIGREEARSRGVKVDDLEACQERQDAVLTLYHLSTIAFEHTTATKVVHSSAGGVWIKNLTTSP